MHWVGIRGTGMNAWSAVIGTEILKLIDINIVVCVIQTHRDPHFP